MGYLLPLVIAWGFRLPAAPPARAILQMARVGEGGDNLAAGDETEATGGPRRFAA